MNIENGQKPFPYLRKGEGLTRYSSLRLPRYHKQNLTNDCRNQSPMDDVEIDLQNKTGNENQTLETARSTETDDSGNASSSPQGNLQNDRVESDNVDSSPKEDATVLDPSLVGRRLAWEEKEKEENVEIHHFEALERFLAAMNSTLKSDCSLSNHKADETPSNHRLTERTPASTTSGELARAQGRCDQPIPFNVSPFPMQFANNLSHRPRHSTTSNGNHVHWRFPHQDAFLTPRLPNGLAQFGYADNPVFPRFQPPASTASHMDMEKELRALMANLERDADELQRRRTLLDEYVESTKKQLCAEWQNIEQEKQQLKIQRMKVEQDKNDLFTHRTKMEEDMKPKLEKCEKSQEELKMFQTECQLLKKKLVEQKKQASEEISSVQQQIIDLQRQAVETDSRASSFRAQITKLKEEYRQQKEEADAAKARISLLEHANERLRVENTQLRSRSVEQRDKDLSSMPSLLKISKTSQNQGKSVQLATGSKSVRFADEPTSFRRTNDFCVQTAGPSDMCTQTSFTECSSPKNALPLCQNAVFQRNLNGGKKEIIYPNNNVQIRDSDGAETINYANGDVLRCLPDGTKIFHSGADGRIEIRNPDGTLLVKNMDGTSEKYTFLEDGTEVITYSNGTIVEKRPYGIEIAYLYDKSKETRCSHYTLREFPSGDVKKLFVDGSTETRLACGRVRIKDAMGNVIKDDNEYSLRETS